MKLAIDPGHGMSNKKPGVFDTGAVAKAGGETFAEADIALRYGLTLKFLAAQRGIDTFMTRTSSAEDAPVGKRASRARMAGCTHFVSLHLNDSEVPEANGLEVLYRSDTKDKPLAQRLQAKLVSITGFRDRGVKDRDDLAVLKFSLGPAVLIELGFIQNAANRTFLLDRDNRVAICNGILDVLTG